MKFPKREDFIETIEYNGEIYSSVNEQAWLCALKEYNRKKARLDSFNERRKEYNKIKNTIKLF